jgi:hypothetical protein
VHLETLISRRTRQYHALAPHHLSCGTSFVLDVTYKTYQTDIGGEEIAANKEE